MGKVFEDEFMDIQVQMIALCLEFVGNEADKIYVYGSIEENSISFNAFFEIQGELKTTNKIVSDTDAVWEFLELGESDLEKMQEACKRYEKPVPTEVKLVYDCDSGKFDTKYQYESICSAKTGVDSSEIFMEWFDEVRRSL